MQKLFNADLLDIVPLERGFTYACRETLPEGGDAVMFYLYNQEIDLFEKIPIISYIKYKFGDNAAVIARELGDFVTCTVAVMSNSRVVSGRQAPRYRQRGRNSLRMQRGVSR